MPFLEKNLPMPKKHQETKKRIFLIEDHTVLRQCFKLFIEQEPDMEVCGEAGSAADAFSAVAELQPDAILTDISLPGMNGIEFIKNLKALHPGIAVVVLSMHEESVYAERALRAGALGYVMKKENTGEVITALRKALKGESHLSSKAMESLMHKVIGRQNHGADASPSIVEQLSDRELEVFEHIGRGESTHGIATAMGMSPKTVETHRMHIKEKLQISSIPELIQRAVVWVEREMSGD